MVYLDNWELFQNTGRSDEKKKKKKNKVKNKNEKQYFLLQLYGLQLHFFLTELPKMINMSKILLHDIQFVCVEYHWNWEDFSIDAQSSNQHTDTHTLSSRLFCNRLGWEAQKRRLEKQAKAENECPCKKFQDGEIQI